MNASLALATAANIDRLKRENDALRNACLLAKAFGSQGETHDGLSVSTIIDNALALRDVGPSAALLHKECGNAVAALAEAPTCPKCGAAMTGQSMAGRRYCESCGHWPVPWSGSPGLGEQAGPTPDV